MTARKPKHSERRAKMKAVILSDEVLNTVVPVGHEPLTTMNWVHLSDPSMQPFMDELRRRIKEEPGFGRALMHDAGILTARGKLTKAFGG